MTISDRIDDDVDQASPAPNIAERQQQTENEIEDVANQPERPNFDEFDILLDSLLSDENPMFETAKIDVVDSVTQPFDSPIEEDTTMDDSTRMSMGSSCQVLSVNQAATSNGDLRGWFLSSRGSIPGHALLLNHNDFNNTEDNHDDYNETSFFWESWCDPLASEPVEIVFVDGDGGDDDRVHEFDSPAGLSHLKRIKRVLFLSDVRRERKLLSRQRCTHTP